MTQAPARGAGLADPVAVLRSRGYVRLLVLAAVLGVPISAAAYGFLVLIHYGQQWVFKDLPAGLGYDPAPAWWPLPVLAVAGALVASAIRYLPGEGGHIPAHGLHVGGAPVGPAELPGVVLAALAGLVLGVVLGPEAPLIAIGGGLGALAVRLARRDAPAASTSLVAASGSFAAISTLLGSPLVGAFLLMEASGLGGAAMGLVLVPGLLCAGIGSLIFVGLGDWTGLGPLSLAVPDLPAVGQPTLSQFGWALVVGVAAAFAGTAIRRSGLALEPLVRRRRLPVTIAAGLVVGALVMLFHQVTGEAESLVLFSGQDALGPLLTGAPTLSAGALALLIACKGAAYAVSLAAFRGGPVFPAVFLGAAGGLAFAHLPGLPGIAGAAMGIGAMMVVMLRLPLTSVLVASLLFGPDQLTLMPPVIVAVVVAHVITARLAPAPPAAGAPPAPP